jgi:hypothetical protein
LFQRNVAPKGRDVNKPQNRDAVEKERLKERRFGYNRYQPEVVDKPFVTLTKAAGFIPGTHSSPDYPLVNVWLI